MSVPTLAEVAHTFTCHRCGKPIGREPKRGRIPTYCSLVCRKNVPNAICVGCGNAFRPKECNRGTYCSRGCAFAHKRRISVARRATAPAHQMPCCWCGQPVIANRHTRFCGKGCARSWHEAQAQNKAERAPVVKRCRLCGKEFTCHRMTAVRSVCSLACTKRHHAHNRRVRVRGAYVEDVTLAYLIERDKGMCGICGKLCDLSAKCPASNAPTIDHILALARGGKHERTNTRLAHFWCNSHRGAGT